jgi:hypothetical protein
VSLSNLNASYVRAEAIDAKGRVLASTGIADVESGKMVSMDTAVINVVEDDDDVVANEDGDTVLMIEALSRESHWRRSLRLLMVFGTVVCACCLLYAVKLKSPWSQRKQKYSPL